jgi:hypothetical protein
MSDTKQQFDWRKHVAVHDAADLFPFLSPDELRALADDIKTNGVRTQIVFDDSGNLLDGRNRLDALALLDLLCVNERCSLSSKDGEPIKWRIENGDPYDIVLSLNVHRRHLTPDQRDEVIAKVLKAKPELSNRQIGKLTKADHHKIAKARHRAEATGEVSPVEKTIGADGKARPATKPKPATPKPSPPARAAVNPKDTALETFDAHILELLRMTKGQKPQRFAKTAVPQPLLGEGLGALPSRAGDRPQARVRDAGCRRFGRDAQGRVCGRGRSPSWLNYISTRAMCRRSSRRRRSRASHSRGIRSLSRGSRQSRRRGTSPSYPTARARRRRRRSL